MPLLFDYLITGILDGVASGTRHPALLRVIQNSSFSEFLPCRETVAAAAAAVRSNQKRIYEGGGGGGSEGISKKTRVTTSERRRDRERERKKTEKEEGKKEREKERERHGEKNDRHTRRQKEGRYVEVAERGFAGEACPRETGIQRGTRSEV